MKLSIASSRMAGIAVCVLCRDHATYSVKSKDDAIRVSVCDRHAKSLDDAEQIETGSAFRIGGDQ